MAISKVILDGSTLLDVTNSTVTSQRILNGYVAKGADGVDVTGSYVPQASGVDIPTFTIVIDPSTGTPQSVTCDKTQAECRSLVLDDSQKLASVEVSVEGAVVSRLSAVSMYANYGADVGYTVYDLGPIPEFDLVYDNGSVSMVEPSDYVGEVEYTENGTYSPSLVADPVVVNVPQPSGSTSITANGTYDVTDYAQAVVNVSGGGDEFKAMIQRVASGVTELPSDITSIGNGAFYGFASLGLASIPNGVTSIGTYAFYGCPNLALTSLPSTVTSIGTYAFYGCTRLALTSLPSGITSVGNYTFNGCTNLALTSLPSTVTSIGQFAFYGCTSLALTSLPSTVTSIGQYAFYGCTSLALTSLPSGITSIAANSFQTCTSLALTSLPSTVTSISSSAFNGCTGLTEISCDGAITTLSTGAFNGNATYPSNLESVSFPNAVVSSLGTAFGSTTAANACQQLETADIGSTSAIAANAFANCYKLRTLVLRKTASVCALNNVSAFLNTPMRGYNGLTGTVYVPSALISSYQTASNWSTLYSDGTVTFSAIEGSVWEL